MLDAHWFSYLPGVAAEVIEHDIVHAPDFAWQVAVSSSHRALRTGDPSEIARSLTTSLATASAHHTVIFQWLLGPRLQPESATRQGQRRTDRQLGRCTQADRVRQGRRSTPRRIAR